MNKPYPKYKDSGVEWLGEMPEGWEKIPIKFLVKPKKFAIKTGPFGSDLKREDFTEQGIKIYNQQNVINNDFCLGDNYINQAKYETLISFTTYAGDILITSRGTIGKCAILPENCDKGILHPCLIRVQVDEAKCYKKFLAYVIQDSNYFYDQLLILSNATTINVIYGDNLSNAVVLLPSINEQISITNFLDQKTTKIDELIKKNERLIELLKEKRQAIISHAVTKGLDPNAKMKDSGIEWIGEIPEGWEVKRLKWTARLEYGSSLSEEAREEGSVPVFGSNGIVGEHSKSITDKPVIIIGRKGSYGKVNYSDVPCFPIDTTYYIDSNLTKENIRWLYYILSSIALDEITFDTGVPGLSREFAYAKIVPFPSKNEQTTIAKYLDQKTDRIDESIQKILSQIEKLKEYRQALISNIVTGKVSVTG